jgi:cyclic pyranopterin phosphate synthase
MSLATALRQLPARSGILPPPRQVDYLRLSITDRCNERCLYCLPENFSDWTAREEVLTFPEILTVVQAAVTLGFRHFRVTGGEPLLRQGVTPFLHDLIRTPGVQSVQLTTNGTRLPELAPALRDAGLTRINVSLDALDPTVYHAITHGDIAPVLQGLELLKQLAFPSVKLNTVLIRGKNEDQIEPLLDFAAKHQWPIRFIELMPVSLTEMLDESNFLPVAEVKNRLAQLDTLEPISDPLGLGPAKYFHLKKRHVTVGFIGALTDLHFCEQCNKVRLTADGKIRPCLGHHGEYDLKPALRPQSSAQQVREILQEALNEKPPEHLFRDSYQPQRIMTAIGG